MPSFISLYCLLHRQGAGVASCLQTSSFIRSSLFQCLYCHMCGLIGRLPICLFTLDWRITVYSSQAQHCGKPRLCVCVEHGDNSFKQQSTNNSSLSALAQPCLPCCLSLTHTPTQTHTHLFFCPLLPPFFFLPHQPNSNKIQIKLLCRSDWMKPNQALQSLNWEFIFLLFPYKVCSVFDNKQTQIHLVLISVLEINSSHLH